MQHIGLGANSIQSAISMETASPEVNLHLLRIILTPVIFKSGNGRLDGHQEEGLKKASIGFRTLAIP